MDETNDEIMEEWLKVNEKRRVNKNNKIPLEYEEFIEWLIEHKNTTFIFASGYGTYDLIIYSDEQHVHISVKLNYKSDIKYNQERGVNLNKTINIDDQLFNELDKTINFHHLSVVPVKAFLLFRLQPSRKIRSLCDPKLKISYTNIGYNIDMKFKNAEKEWLEWSENLFGIRDKLVSSTINVNFEKGFPKYKIHINGG